MSAFSWKQYVTISEQLSFTTPSSQEQECLDRIFISRAYYGVFCQLRDLLIEASIIKSTQNSDVHKLVVDKLDSAGSKKLKTISNDLKRLRIKRNNADYDSPSINNSDSERDLCIALAKSIQEDIDKNKIWTDLPAIPLN